MGWLISISGLDGAGKSTLIESLITRFKAAGDEVKFVRIRLGFTPLLERIKALAGREADPTNSTSTTSPHRKKSTLHRLVWHLYRLGSLLDMIGLFAWISLQRAAGKRVISDRFHWDNWIIYLEKYGQPGWLARLLWAIIRLTAGKPDAAFLLLIPPEESYRRVLERNLGAVEESPEVLQRRAALYKELRHPGLVQVDALQPPEQILEEVWGYIEKSLDRGGIPIR